MIKPSKYNEVVHSFLNAATGMGLARQQVINQLEARVIQYADLKDSKNLSSATGFYNFYALINRGRKRPVTYDKAITDYNKQYLMQG